MQESNNIKSISGSLDRLGVASLSALKDTFFMTEHRLIVPSLDIPIIEKFKSYLLRDSDEVTLETKFFYRPDLFSYDYYGLLDYYFIIMYVNDIFSFSDFKRIIIKAPTKDSIKNLLLYSQVEKNEVLVTVDKKITI